MTVSASIHPPVSRAVIVDPSVPSERVALDGWRERGAIWATHDTLDAQLDQLIESRRPALRSMPSEARADELRSARQEIFAETPPEHFGRWVLYPWSGQLVRLLPPDAFHELRLDRNRNKITSAEQAELRKVTVGVVGLSVGNAVALNIALEGACGHLVLADFDTLELSNMNRIRAATHALGLPKTVLVARQIAEIDPYLPVTVHSEGVDVDNLDAFFDGPPPLDIVIDECDSIDVKFMIREHARARCLPVLMDTSDRSLLDVERFDLEPDRPLFHGRVRERTAEELGALSADDRLRCLIEMVGGEDLSTSMAASLMEVGSTLCTWPQLASDVLLGGASVTHAVRRLALGLSLPSGRRVLDLEASVDAVQEWDVEEAPAAGAHVTGAPLDLEDRLLSLLSEATLAPSGGNTQPWCFEVEGEQIDVCLDAKRETGLLDADSIPSLLALGAAVDILCIGAAARDHRADVRWCPLPERSEVVARVVIGSPARAEDDVLAKLHPLVPRRHTNRRTAPSLPLRPAERDAIGEVAAPFGVGIDWIEDSGALASLGETLGQAERIRALHPGLNADLAREISFDPVGEVFDAISIDTLEASELDRIAYRLLFRPDVATRVKATGGGDRLADRSRAELDSASAVGILRAEAVNPAAVLQAGRAMHRAWLEAERLGLGFQPVGTLPLMARLMNDAESCPFDASERLALRELEERLGKIHTGLVGDAVLFVFRLHRAPAPSARSLRLPLDAVAKVPGKGSV